METIKHVFDRSRYTGWPKFDEKSVDLDYFCSGPRVH